MKFLKMLIFSGFIFSTLNLSAMEALMTDILYPSDGESDDSDSEQKTNVAQSVTLPDGETILEYTVDENAIMHITTKSHTIEGDSVNGWRLFNNDKLFCIGNDRLIEALNKFYNDVQKSKRFCPNLCCCALVLITPAIAILVTLAAHYS